MSVFVHAQRWRRSLVGRGIGARSKLKPRRRIEVEALEARWVFSAQGFDFVGEVGVQYLAGSGPRSLAAADYNQDGEVDFATANVNGDSISVLLNRRDGTLGLPLTLSVPPSPKNVVAVDIDNDGLVDLVAAHSRSIANENIQPSISVVRNLGGGTFASFVSLPMSDTEFFEVRAADVDSDGLVDLVTTRGEMLKNLGNGGFAAAATLVSGASFVDVAEMTGDGHVDLVTRSAARDSFSILANSGSGAFSLLSTHSPAQGVDDLFVGGLERRRMARGDRNVVERRSVDDLGVAQ